MTARPTAQAVPPTAAAAPKLGSLSRLPKTLSPSRASDFRQCPRKFYYRTILGLQDPGSEATLRGTLAHTACERIFDHPRPERTVERAVEYVYPAWRALSEPAVARDSVEPGSPEALVREATGAWADLLEKDDYQSKRLLRSAQDAHDVLASAENPKETEEALLASTEDMVRRWFGMENPQKFDPTGRELKIGTDIGGVRVFGIIDRVDAIRRGSEERVFISDYKTGKVPTERYLDAAFEGLRVYALLWHSTRKTLPYALRLVYLKDGSSAGVKQLEVTQTMVEDTRVRLQEIWRDIVSSATNEDWQPSTGPLCGWCSFKKFCPAFSTAPQPPEEAVLLGLAPTVEEVA